MYKTDYKKYLKQFLLRGVNNPHFRQRATRILAVILRNLPKSLLKYAEYQAIHDIAFTLQQIYSGASLEKSHSFAKILGPSKSISFIFPYYKKEKDILRAIHSLKSQNYKNLNPKDVEIIVIDDGSDELIDDILDDDVIYVRRNKFQYGISRSRNLGAKISSGRVLVFVDPDFIFHENYVETIYEEYKKFGRKAVLTGYVCDYFYEGCEDPRTAFGVWENPNRKCKRFLHLAGGHMVIDRDVFFNVGGFDEDLIYGEVEDTLFGFRLSEISDLNIVFADKIWVQHVPHPTGLAHGEPSKSFSVSAYKAPEFYWNFVIKGER